MAAAEKMIQVPERDYQMFVNALALANSAMNSIQKKLHKEEQAGVSTLATRKGINTNRVLQKRLKTVGK